MLQAVTSCHRRGEQGSALSGAGLPPQDVQRAQVFARVRPVCGHDEDHDVAVICGVPEPDCVTVLPSTGATAAAATQQRFSNVFAAEASNATVYDGSVRDAVRGVLRGEHALVVAAGERGAGKTHSLVGHSSAGSTADEAGLIGHAVEDIFGQLPPQRDSVSANTCWVARVMFLQIHREQVCDLLAAENGAQDALCGAARKVNCG